jgi:hypothetical protein
MTELANSLNINRVRVNQSAGLESFHSTGIGIMGR